MNIRSFSWLADNLSWSTTLTELINAFDDLGHNTFVVSTNGMNEALFKKKNKMISSIAGLQNFGPGKSQIDIDLTYTIPANFPQRFLQNSKHRAAIYTYEYPIWPSHWRRFYNLVNFYFPPSNFAAEVFYNNGIPSENIFVVPHGLDIEKFNPQVPKYPLKTQKSFKFVSVVAPHSRKRIDVLLRAYCEAFTSKDDVCLVLKTRAYRGADKKQLYEVCIGDYLDELRKKHGPMMPEIEIVEERINNVASIYNACHVHISTTGSEGFGIPFLEALNCGVNGNMFNIATNYSGQLDFLNKDNSLLIDCKIVKAKKEDQYWHYDKRNQIAQASQTHTSELMIKAYKEYDQLLSRFRPNIVSVIEKYSWKNAAQMIINACEGNGVSYKPGTVRLPK